MANFDFLETNVTCPNCRQEIERTPALAGMVIPCPRCRRPVQMTSVSANPYASPGPSRSAKSKAKSVSDQVPMSLGMAGAAVLMLAFFCPVVKIPVLGSFSYLGIWIASETKGAPVNELMISGAVVLCFSVLALVISLTRIHAFQFISGISAIAAAILTAVVIETGKADARKGMQEEAMNDNPFAGMAEMAVDLVQIDFGVGVVVAAGLLLIAAGGCHLMNKPAR